MSMYTLHISYKRAYIALMQNKLVYIDFNFQKRYNYSVFFVKKEGLNDV